MRIRTPSAAVWSAILAVVLIAQPVGVRAQALQDEREAFEYARVLFSDGLHDTAAEEFRRFILNYPTSERLAQARLTLADAHFRAKSLKEAIDAYQIFVDRHPDNIEVAAALRNRATALEQLTEHTRAAAAFTDLYDRFKTGEYAVQDLLSAGTNSRQAADPSAAEESFRTIIINHPSSPLLREATYNLGLVLIDQARDSEALRLFESIEESEREPDALLEIGRIQLTQDNLIRAEETFSSLRKRFPGTRSAQQSYLVLGEWYEDQREWTKASETYNAARTAKLGADHQQMAILGLARVYRKTGRDALQLYTQFLKVYPKSRFVPNARLGLGRSFVDKGQHRQAIDAFKRLQEGFPDHTFSITAYRDIGDVFASLGSPRRALAAYQRHLELSQNSGESAITQLSMGRVYQEQLGWTDKAREILESLAESEDPDIAAPAQFELGQTYESDDNPHLAIREYRNYLERFAGAANAKETERRIRYLSDYVPTGNVDQEILTLLSHLPAGPAARLSVGRMLHSSRYYDEAIPHLEVASVDTSDLAAEGTFLLAETLLFIDRRQSLLDGSSARHRERVLDLYRGLTEDTNFADDATLRIIELEKEGQDTSSVRGRIAAYETFLKTYPDSDRLGDVRLRLADTHLSLGRSDPVHIDQALASYRQLATSEMAQLSEAASYGVGRCLAIKGQYVEAENALRDFLFAYPDSDLDEEARFQLGLILLERGYLQSAAAEFADLLKAPTSVDLEEDSRKLLAECYFRLENFQAAARIDETLLSRGEDPAVLRRLGEAYSRLGEDEKAISALGRYARKFADAAGADTLAFRRAELLAQLGRANQAIDAFATLTKTYPKSALKSMALASSGRLHFERGNYESALAAVSGAQAEESIVELRILSLLRLDRAKQARKEIKSFKKAYPGSREALASFDVEQARVQLRYNNPKVARKTLQDVIKKHAGTRAAVDAEYFLVEALEEVGKPEEHLAALVAFVKNRKDNEYWARANLDLAEIHERDQDYVGASRRYLNALSGHLEDSERPVVLKKLYDAHRNLRSYDTAISYARELIDQYPDHRLAQDARIRIGEIFSEKGDYNQAIAELRPLLTKLQGNDWSSAQLVIATSYQELGEHESALREYLKMIYNHQGSVNWLPNAFYGRAQCFRSLGRSKEAFAELDKITARFAGTAFVLQAEQMREEMRVEMSQR